MNFSDIFEEFHETPLGVGAMGQVYQAKLKPGLYIDQSHRHSSENDANSSSSGGLFYTEDGRPVSKLTSKVLQSFKKQGTPPAPSNWVVIKVLHPNVQRIVERDITIMKFFANAINWIPTMEWLSLPGEVEMFGHMMRLQLDLRIEADNLLMFRHNFSSASSSSSLRRNKDVAFPKPYIQYSSKEVLVEEFISGIPMTEFLKHTNGSKLDKEISDKGLDAFLKMLLLDNFIHSDLHPGNIYVRLYKDDHQIDQTNDEDVVELTNKIMELKGDQEKWQKKLDDLYEQGYRAQVCFIDTGLVTQLNDTNRRNFLDLFKAVAQFDGYHVGELMVERSRTPETAIDPELFALKVERLVYNIKQRTFALGSVKLGDLLFKVLSMVRQHHVRMEGDFITVVLSILLLEGIGRQLDPELDLFKSSIPILRQLGANERNEFLSDDTFSMAKVWLALEVRQFISASIQDVSFVFFFILLLPF